MPELPEVETVVRTLRPTVASARIIRVKTLRADIVTPPRASLRQRLAGQVFADIQRRGKKILFTLNTGEQFVIHLGMSGRLTLDAPSTPIRPHTHFILELIPLSGQLLQLRFVDPRRFGGIWWLGTSLSADDRLGPEPLKVSTAQLKARLAKTRRAIKTALLDQQLIAGIGNIYADEALHRAGIDPRAAACTLDNIEVGRLNRAIKQVLHSAIKSRGSSLRDYVDANGLAGGFQKLHRVYARTGQPCDHCGAPIQRITLAGRSTHFCPACQHR